MGAPRLVEACKRELRVKEGDTTADGKFTLATVRCLGCCGLAAVMTVNEDVYGHFTTAKIPPLLKRYRVKGPEDDVEEADSE
jgi:NADH:ubiquinone oxidoreductase subunit E